MNSGTLLKVADLSKGFCGRRIFSGVSFSMNAGETLAVIGPSGCGKSTLLSIIASLASQDGGEVLLAQHCRTAYVMQDYGLFPWKTVGENLMLPLTLAGTSKKERESAVAGMLETLGLAGAGRRFPVQLSGGQRQRVAIGRALIASPDLLLMDEPFAALDSLTREHLQDFILEIWRKRRLSFIIVTHNIAEAARLGQTVLVMGNSRTPPRILKNPCFGDRPECRENAEFSLAVRSALEEACAVEVPHEDR